MIRKLIVFLFSSLFLITSASAATIELFDWAFYVDGVTYEDAYDDAMPTTGALTNGLGTLTWSTSSAGDHTFLAFFDHDIDVDVDGNGYSNEYGTTHGALAADQSWEIDDPWYGDIYENSTGFDPIDLTYTSAIGLDNTNEIDTSPNDVSLAMGWDFSLTPGETAEIILELGLTVPSTGFYLSHTDPDSSETLYFSSTLSITGGSASATIPEPGTVFLFGFGIVALLGMGRKKDQQ